MNINTLYDNEGNSYPLLKILGSGNKSGEGTAYLTHEDLVIKVFEDETLLHESKQQKVQRLIDKKIKFSGICFPLKELFTNEKKFAGYLMPLAEGYNLQISLFNKIGIQNNFPHWSRIQLCEVCLSIIDKVTFLQENNIYITDFNPLNTLVDKDANIYFVDTDSYQVDELLGIFGHPLFTPPELLTTNNAALIIKKEHEYYSVAVLMFMIFLNGKHPFSYQGGGSWRENIKTRNFSYPFGDKDNYKTPSGDYEVIWNELGYDLKKAFFDVFKNQLRIGFKKWKEILGAYKESLSKNIYPLSIFPKTETRSIEEDRAKIYDGDISDRFVNLRNDVTNIGRNLKNPKIAVLELSTKAVKLLMGDQEMIKKYGFNFKFFPPSTRPSIYCNPGLGKMANGFMNMLYFEDKIIPQINMAVDIARVNKVDILYSVATAVYRSSKNRSEIIKRIKSKCGINVKILSQKEEALATIRAFLYSRPPAFPFSHEKNYMMIDQGGGSTEISVFKGQAIVNTYSVGLGSTAVKNIMFDEATTETTFDAAFKDSHKHIKATLRKHLRNHNYSNLDESCIGVGNSIIQATEAKNAYEKHGRVLSLQEIKNKIEEYDLKLRSQFKNLKELSDAIKKDETAQLFTSKKSNQTDNDLVTRIALPIFVEIMEYYNLKNVIVSNTGLWYGIYFEKLFN